MATSPGIETPSSYARTMAPAAMTSVPNSNASWLAQRLEARGIRVVLVAAVPDELDRIVGFVRREAPLVDHLIVTGGLGGTPDDLTREAIAAVCGEFPAVDDRLEAWLRELWFRRGMPFPEINLKQAWLIPSAKAIPNRNGTAPGWWVERPGGRVIVALPGPPREMRPMWRDAVLPRLHKRGLGVERVTRTLRLWGVGESQAADLIGEAVLRRANPAVATYARSDSVDVRISAVGETNACRIHRIPPGASSSSTPTPITCNPPSFLRRSMS